MMNRTLSQATAMQFNMQGKRNKRPFTKLLLHKLIIGLYSTVQSHTIVVNVLIVYVNQANAL
jgi:hypothetical protein